MRDVKFGGELPSIGGLPLTTPGDVPQSAKQPVARRPPGKPGLLQDLADADDGVARRAPDLRPGQVALPQPSAVGSTSPSRLGQSALARRDGPVPTRDGPEMIAQRLRAAPQVVVVQLSPNQETN